MIRLILSKSEKDKYYKKTKNISLGNWCDNKIDKDTNYAVKYHWNDQNKIDKDYNYLINLYEKILNNLHIQLNTYHNVSFNNRYWRILIGPWLFSFIFSIFDRHEIIKSLEKDYKNYYVNKYINNLKSINLFSYDSYFQTFDDLWNYYIFIDLIENFTKIKIINLNDNLNTIKLKKNNNKNSFKENIKNIFNLFNNKNNKIVLDNAHLSIFDKIKFYFKIKQFPSFLNFNIYNKYLDDRSFMISILKHDFKLSINTQNSFEIYLNKKIENFIPRIFTTHFQSFNKFIDKQNFPNNPNLIYTNNSFFLNDVFNFYTANNIVKNKTNYIIGQHGGGYNIGKFHFIKNHENIICDSYISWGTTYDEKSISGSILKSSKFHRLNVNYENKSKILIVTNAWERFPTWSLHLNGDSYEKYVINREYFLSKLNSTILSNIEIRLYKYNLYNLQKKYWMKKYPNLKIDNGINNIYHSFINSKIIITDFLYSTTYLESLYLNIPTILINDENLFQLDRDCISIINQLKDAKIYFNSYSLASEHLNKVYNNVNQWWFNENVIEAKRNFLEKYCKNAKDFSFLKFINNYVN